MNVNRYYLGGRQVESLENSLHKQGFYDSVVRIVEDCIILNCDSRVEMSVDAKYNPEGNGTEVGMLRFLQQNDVQIHERMIAKQRDGEHECSIPFGPIRKEIS